MVIGITFFIFLFLGFFVFWGGYILYGKRYDLLNRKLSRLKEEVKTNDKLLKLKTKMENTISELINEEKVINARIHLKLAKIDHLERDVASLEDQTTAEDIKVELVEIREKKESGAKEIKKLNDQLNKINKALAHIDETYAQEKFTREEALKEDLTQQRQKLHDELNEDITQFKEEKLTETKATIDNAKISAIKSIKDWWNDEKKRLYPLLEKDFNQKRSIHQQRMAEQAAKDIIDLKNQYAEQNI